MQRLNFGGVCERDLLEEEKVELEENKQTSVDDGFHQRTFSYFFFFFFYFYFFLYSHVSSEGAVYLSAMFKIKGNLQYGFNCTRFPRSV